MSAIEAARQHPADLWQQASGQVDLDRQTRLRLAAIAGHMRLDMVTARRAALVDLLSDGAPHQRQEIWETVQTKFKRPCWGRRPEETLWRDLRALRGGGLRIAYSRRRGASGYFLQFPPIEKPEPIIQKPIEWRRIATFRQMPVAEKNRQAFAAAAFALRQKQLILALENPDWPGEKVEATARQLVYGT